jgi:hypothetical protein
LNDTLSCTPLSAAEARMKCGLSANAAWVPRLNAKNAARTINVARLVFMPLLLRGSRVESLGRR